MVANHTHCTLQKSCHQNLHTPRNVARCHDSSSRKMQACHSGAIVCECHRHQEKEMEDLHHSLAKYLLDSPIIANMV